ncbi:AT-hook motif nuclear-localized protein 7-like [Macadamia integrifolia]|uniref:AT-hook motif nuclear-localized protein 7-like n=1 Tax=Macadamia integrifolia TaxID=60698 RepID=UPI001C4EDF00|nr:AT-hook motif nuclear-localized protein 7-like [Macadamia integrifolia]
MEGRGSTISGSTANTESDSPVSGPLPSGGMDPQVMNMAINMGMQRSLRAAEVGGVDMMSGKKKRGRPRKYGSDGSIALVISQGFSSTQPDFTQKRGRGRPPGSGNRQILASLGDFVSNSAGGNFMPHVVTIHTGEDVAAKIYSFARKGPRAICILSANGSVSNVTIHQPGSSGGLLTYEGRFEILSLSGSFAITETAGVRDRTGGLSVSLAGPDGRVIGGGVAGLLMAASPIQVVVGSFMSNYKPHKKKYQYGFPMASVIPVVQGAPNVVTAARPISQAKPDDDNCVTPTSALPGQSHGEEDNCASSNPNPNSGFKSADWNASESEQEQKPSPDINECVPVE